MSRKIKISALILLYFLACAKSCDNQEQNTAARENARVKAVTDSLRAAFGADTLEPAALRSFEVSAKMKFSDYCDYLRILSDSNTAVPFREKAREMIGRLFLNGIAPDMSMFEPDSVRVIEPLEYVSDSLYEGVISFWEKPGQLQNGKQGNDHSKGMMTIFLVKREKVFGNDTLNVWGVYLGEMK